MLISILKSRLRFGFLLLHFRCDWCWCFEHSAEMRYNGDLFTKTNSNERVCAQLDGNNENLLACRADRAELAKN